jgi:hypothetical protein
VTEGQSIRIIGESDFQRLVAPIETLPFKNQGLTMALKPCKECGKEVSTSAKTCPHCGVKEPVVNTVAQTIKGLATLGVIGAIAVIWLQSGSDKSGTTSNNAASTLSAQSAAPAAPTCKADWKKCVDNADMANNYRSWYKAQADCKIAAEKLARYGDPKWPWFAFGSFLKGDGYAKTGHAVLIEPDAQFQNGFGAMQHVRVNCEYDLTNEKVLSAEAQ